MSEPVAKEHRTVSRVTGILESVARQGGARMHELAEALDAPKSSVFGLVKGLVSTGYLTEERGVYRLGPALGSLLSPSAPDVIEAATPSLEALRDEFGETAMLGTAVGDSLIYIAAAESQQLIRYSAPLRTRRPLYPPSAGKVILACRSARRRDSYLDAVLPSAVERKAARDELARVWADGVAFNRGETLPDVSAAARPILVRGEVRGVIAVAGPTSRILDRLPAVARALTGAVESAAVRLSV
ncbi:IclR family transcriptional regulator [Streptomyces iconiensis]|uniref:IclR family transcriptional regulator C-terminal domain-containing protein n=1 Tax=Streptomyces iconiensis TaxID=1384038 RepID=A0ABT7A7H3_9ACTN|nr:IclR family transcriptional regulator C-terminal domain-containing protein [Streptomyces iconiensis]MDJ1136974.1 IclR family transcriptional regulator C-terminal domain-containing protein [Streptomyces iconiensis]